MNYKNDDLPPAELVPYKELQKELSSKVELVERLHTERQDLRAQDTRNRESRDRLADQLLDGQKVQEELHEQERELQETGYRLEAMERRIHHRESELHELLPLACDTFGRLLHALRSRVFERGIERLCAVLHPTMRGAHLKECEALAQFSKDFVDLAEISVPSSGHWQILRPLLPEQRDDVVRAVLETSHALLDAADDLLFEVERITDVKIPVYALGELPTDSKGIMEPISSARKVEPVLLEALESDEREFLMEVCRESERDPASLTDADRTVLAVTLENWKASRRTGR